MRRIIIFHIHRYIKINSTYYIYHNNVKTSLDAMKKAGKLDQNVDTSRAAADFVKVMFGTDTFDETPMSQWTPVIMAVNRYTGEAQVIFRERDILKDYPDIFPGYPPYLKGVNYLAGYRMAFEFKGKIYFAGMGNPTATLIEVDPETNECSIAYHNINYTQGVSNGVHGLLVFDDEIYMCLASDNYDGKGTPGGIIVASSDPTAGLSSWRRVADQDDFDGLPAVMKTDGLNGGGIWDIIEYNGSMYVTVVTDKSIDGHINKQGFAMYRGDKHEDGSFTWTQGHRRPRHQRLRLRSGHQLFHELQHVGVQRLSVPGHLQRSHAGPGGGPRLRQL